MYKCVCVCVTHIRTVHRTVYAVSSYICARTKAIAWKTRKFCANKLTYFLQILLYLLLLVFPFQCDCFSSLFFHANKQHSVIHTHKLSQPKLTAEKLSALAKLKENSIECQKLNTYETMEHLCKRKPRRDRKKIVSFFCVEPFAQIKYEAFAIHTRHWMYAQHIHAKCNKPTNRLANKIDVNERDKKSTANETRWFSNCCDCCWSLTLLFLSAQMFFC